MADDNVKTGQSEERYQQPQQVSIVNDFIGQLLQGETEGKRVLIAKVQEDGTMREWSLTVGLDPDGNERIIAIDENRNIQHVPIVTDENGNQLPIAGTSEGVLRVDIAGATKREEIDLMRGILNELRLVTRLFLTEMTGDEFGVRDLGVLEEK